jgi:thiosulfate reductase cytochrome b subunit
MSATPQSTEAGGSRPLATHSQDLIVRYDASERTNHWLGAICFVLAALSGLALFHPALFFLSNLIGGGPWTRILHPYLGLAMCLSFVFLASRVARDNRMQPKDWQWLRQYRDVIENREERLPEVGRYNAGQKLVFYAVVGCLTLLLLTGIIIWRVYTTGYFPMGPGPHLHHHRARLCGDLGQGVRGGHDARNRDARLGMEAPPRLVSRDHGSCNES